jgi:uncharacterized membrane protein YhaH (DUF805 family)
METSLKNSNIIHFFSASGRLSRGRFWIYWLVLFVLQTSLLLLIGTQGDDLVTSTITITVLFSGFIYLQLIKRMHDVGKSGWYSLVPFYNIILALIPGDEGSNEYGNDPFQPNDDLLIQSEVLDQQIQSAESDDHFSLTDELKNFLIYNIVSRVVYFFTNLWWSNATMNGIENITDLQEIYQTVNEFTDAALAIWLFVLMGKSVNKWMQWIYFIFLTYKAFIILSHLAI